MSNKLLAAIRWLTFALGVWLVASSLAATPVYGRLTFGLLILWLSAIWLKQSLEQRYGALQGWPAWAVNAVLALIPGLILFSYGAFTPAQPSLTNSGIDVCQLSTGFCVSGSRTFVFFGGVLFLAGVAWSYFMFTIEKKARR
jgi:hypothetical protein